MILIIGDFVFIYLIVGNCVLVFVWEVCDVIEIVLGLFYF